MKLYDAIPKLWSSRWLNGHGEITAIAIESTKVRNRNIWGLSVAYKFSAGKNGLYRGKAFWTPAFSFNSEKKVQNVRQVLQLHQPVNIRYHEDDPSANMLIGGVRGLLKNL